MPLTFEAFVLCIGISGLVVLLAILWRKKRSPGYLFCFTLFWVYLLLVAGLTIFPIPLVNAGVDRWVAVHHILSRVNLIPFDFGGLFGLHPNVVFQEIVGNILLTAPFGFGVPYLARVRGKAIIWLALGVGTVIETTQLMVSIGIGGAYRGVDINDVLLNAAGVWLGYALFRALAGLTSALKSSPEILPKS
jgi:glycopeptide antibiotics resistance protein